MREGKGQIFEEEGPLDDSTLHSRGTPLKLFTDERGLLLFTVLFLFPSAGGGEFLCANVGNPHWKNAFEFFTDVELSPKSVLLSSNWKSLDLFLGNYYYLYLLAYIQKRRGKIRRELIPSVQRGSSNPSAAKVRYPYLKIGFRPAYDCRFVRLKNAEFCRKLNRNFPFFFSSVSSFHLYRKMIRIR